MKVGIIGAGAMGSLYGSAIAEQGHEVWFIDVFQEHVDKINQEGLRVRKNGEDRIVKNIKATSNAKEAGIVDLAIVFVKSTITDLAVQQNRAVFGENTIVLTLQNGIGNIEKIETVVNKENIIAGTSANGASMIEPGHINHAGWGGTVIGELDGANTERIQQIAELLGHGKLGPVTISNNVLGLIWDKLLANVGINPLTAILRVYNGDLLDDGTIEKTFEELVQEGVEVAQANSITLSFKDSVEHAKNVARQTAANTSSMLADIMHKRRTEIDNINGAIVRLGEELHVPTPMNKLITSMVREIEKYTVQ